MYCLLFAVSYIDEFGMWMVIPQMLLQILCMGAFSCDFSEAGFANGESIIFNGSIGVRHVALLVAKMLQNCRREVFLRWKVCNLSHLLFFNVATKQA